MYEDYLIHITTEKCLSSIATEGLREMSYWAEPGRVSDYYAETVRDEEEVPVEIRLPLSVLEGLGMDVDVPGIEEPLTYTLGMSEEEVAEEWEGMEPTWQNSLALIGSCRCTRIIPVSVLLEHNPVLNAKPAPRKASPGGRPGPR